MLSGGSGSVTDIEVAPSAETRAPMLAIRDGARARRSTWTRRMGRWWPGW